MDALDRNAIACNAMHGYEQYTRVRYDACVDSDDDVGTLSSKTKGGKTVLAGLWSNVVLWLWV